MPNKTSKPRILIVSHGHPDISPGGGEIAAYNLHKALQASDEFSSVFLARHNDPKLVHGGTTFAGTGRPAEILFYSAMPDWFRFSQPDKAKVWRDFREALEAVQPDIVHFHHYVHLGLELIREVRNFSAEIRIVLTLHEYFGICHNQGQMVKVKDRSLCYRATPSDCARCFPEYQAQDFMLRERFIKSHFDLVDQFISPSEFLKSRYVGWGIGAERIEVIDNILEPQLGPPIDNARTTVQRVRFAYFGQINPFKGVDILLDAFTQLPERHRAKVRLDIHGAGLERQPRDLQALVKSQLQRLKGIATLHGRYSPRELTDLMGSTDWVLVPSRWWENSPMVILEARQHGTPTICSNIGGMQEKVKDNITGLHFLTGRPDSLAERIMWVLDNPQSRSIYSANILAEHNEKTHIKAHWDIYRRKIHKAKPLARNAAAA